MLPIGYGERIRGRRPWSIMAYGLGSPLGAVALGLAVGRLGDIVLAPVFAATRAQLVLLLTGAVGAVYGLADASIVHVPAPRVTKQVPASWYKRFSPVTTGLLYGSALGFGIGTRIQVATYYLLPVWAFSVGGAFLPALVFGAFGVGRFLPLVLIGTRRAAEVDRLEALMDRIEAFEPLVKLASGLVLTFVGSYLLASLVVNGLH